MTQNQQAEGVLLPGEGLAYEEGVLHLRPSAYTGARPEGSLPEHEFCYFGPAPLSIAACKPPVSSNV